MYKVVMVGLYREFVVDKDLTIENAQRRYDYILHMQEEDEHYFDNLLISKVVIEEEKTGFVVKGVRV